MTSDIQTIQDFVTYALLAILTSVLVLIGIVGVMLSLNWRFTLISLAIAPLLFLMVYVFTGRIKRASRNVWKKEGELLSIVQEVFSSIRVVKAFAREDYEQRRFEAQSLDNMETTLAARNIKMTLAPVVEIIVATGTCLMLWYGGRLVMAGQLTAGRARGVPALPGQDVQADAGPLEDDRHRRQGRRQPRADPRDSRHRERCPRPASRADGQAVSRARSPLTTCRSPMRPTRRS